MVHIRLWRHPVSDIRLAAESKSLPNSSGCCPLPRECGIVTVIDGHPATLGWLGSVRGHRVEALGVEHFGQTGTINDLYRHHGMDANAIIDAAEGLTAGAPVRHRKMAV
jgi:pyruvate dehydrogenase E1 component